MNALTTDELAGRFSHKGPVMIENAREILGVDLSPDNAMLLDALGIMTPEQSGRLVSDRSHDYARPEDWTHEKVKRRLSQKLYFTEDHFSVGQTKKVPKRSQNLPFTHQSLI